jgi:S-DNA-T family DNA segregation ATPase FtsK/SpoIIIE
LDGLVRQYHARLRIEVTRLRARPDLSTWSALEYACHVRDCLALYELRIQKALSEERPDLPQMRRDEIVVERRYNETDPVVVAEEMAENRSRLAALLDQVGDTDWQSVAIREGEELSVAWMAINTLHEAQHHLMDVDRVLDRSGPEAASS